MQKNKILIIEDESDVAKLLASRLRSAGYETVIAGDGVQGVQFAHKEKPDLIILDLMLPAGNGLTVLDNLRMSFYSRYIPVLVLSGADEEEFKGKALEKGAEAYLEKPYEPQVLLAAVRSLLAEKEGKNNPNP